MPATAGRITSGSSSSVVSASFRRTVALSRYQVMGVPTATMITSETSVVFSESANASCATGDRQPVQKAARSHPQEHQRRSGDR